MRSAQLVSLGLVGALMLALAGDAPAAGVSPRKIILLPKGKGKPVARYAPQVAKPVPRLALRVPVAPVQRAALTPPATIVIAQAPADPSKPQLLALSGDWSAFRAGDDRGRTCFGVTRPKDSSPRQASRDSVYLYLTDAPPDHVKHELTFKLGLDADSSSVIANVDGKDFQLAAKSGIAYPPDERTQREMLQAMRRGHTLVLHTGSGTSAVTDSFSLLGLDDSMRASDQACAEVSASK